MRLIDTDVFVDHLRGAQPLDPSLQPAGYSVVTRCELFSGRRADEDRINLLLAPYREYLLDRTIAERAGKLRQAGALRTPDALIAATAIERGLELVTRNKRDFEGIDGLAVAPPPRQ